MSNAERQKFNAWLLEFDNENKLNDEQKELMFIAWEKRAKEEEKLKLAAQYAGQLNERNLLAMQAAWIEQHYGKGAEEAMDWIESTLEGPGLIPDEDDEDFVKDAQAYFDNNVAEIDKAMGEISTALDEFYRVKP